MEERSDAIHTLQNYGYFPKWPNNLALKHKLLILKELKKMAKDCKRLLPAHKNVVPLHGLFSNERKHYDIWKA